MKKLLITGFMPFNGEKINPSWQAVLMLDNQIGDYELTKMLVPVVFEKGAKAVIEKATKLCPDAILCIGQAGGRNAITPELVAINLRHAEIPDNEGNKPQDQPIISGGENAYFSTIPSRKIASAINELGILSKVSYSAGAYVCNDLLYNLLAYYKNTNIKVGFIHVPYCTEQNKEPSTDLSNIVKALTTTIKNI